MNKIYFTAVVILLWIPAFCARAAELPPQSDYQEELEKQQVELMNLEKDLGIYRSDMKDLALKETALKGKISQVEKKIANYKHEESDILKKMEQVDINMEYLQGELKKGQSSSGKYREIFRSVIRNYYMQKKQCDSMPWFGPVLCDVPQDMFLQKLMVMFPAEKYAQINREILTITSLKSELQEEKENQNMLKEQLITVKKNLITEKKKQLRILNNTEGERKRIKDLVAMLEKRSKNLKRLQMLAKDFIPAKGNLPWPAAGSITAFFGKQKHPELDTYIISRGITIKPSEGDGADVRVIAAGEVVYAQEFEGLEKMVVIEHGNGYYTLYANLKELLVDRGGEVGPLVSLGKAGFKDIYFEIGKGSTPEDPLLWLGKDGSIR